jgi:hypothetical protein
MKKFILLLSLFQIVVYAQSTLTPLSIEIKKAKIVDNVSVVGIRQLSVTSDDLQKVMIKTKITSDEKDRVKLSAFYLLDTLNKIRYRLADYKGYVAVVGFPEFIPYRVSELYDEKGRLVENINIPPYDPSQKDYYNDYNKEGYSNFELKINFGTTKHPLLSVLYFGETEYDKFTAELYFAILGTHINATYELYYKDQKIGDISFQ